MKLLSENWAVLYMELANNLQDVLDENRELVPRDPRKEIAFHVPSQNILDDFKNVFHFKIAIASTEQRLGMEDDKSLIMDILEKHQLFEENVFPKAAQISKVMDDLIKIRFGA